MRKSESKKKEREKKIEEKNINDERGERDRERPSKHCKRNCELIRKMMEKKETPLPLRLKRDVRICANSLTVCSNP